MKENIDFLVNLRHKKFLYLLIFCFFYYSISVSFFFQFSAHFCVTYIM